MPLAHDGMGVFNMSDGRFRLVRNHEDRNAAGAGTVAVDANAYDRKGGGTTTLVVNPFTRELERDFISLCGTTVNCAGGITPWGSWITSEETNVGPTAAGWTRQHGYSFDVPAAANSTVPAVALTAMGRFSHEAVAVDPNTWIVYQTEDNGSTSGFYRFLANKPGVLKDGGKLEMLAIDGTPNYDTRTGQTLGAALPVKWVPLRIRTRPARARPRSTTRDATWRRPLCAARGLLVRQRRDLLRLDQRRQRGRRPGVGIPARRRWRHAHAHLRIAERRGAGRAGQPRCLSAGRDLAVRGRRRRSVHARRHPRRRDLRLCAQSAERLRMGGATFAEADPSWNDSKIRGEHKPLGGRWDRVTLFVNRQGATGGPNPPLGGNEGMTFAIWGPWKNGALCHSTRTNIRAVPA